MKSSELRIGNYVYNAVGILSKVTARMILEQYQSEIAKQEYLNQIQLTEQWLLDFGFQKIRNKFYLGNEFYLIRYKLNNSFIVYYCGSDIIVTEIEFVHILQNFCFFNTREELTIKEKV